MKKKKSSSEVRKKKKVHNKNKYIFVMMLIALIMLIVSGVVLYLNYCDQKLLSNIKKHYGNQVIMVNDAKLYDHNENKYDLNGRTSISLCRCGASEVIEH